MPTRSARWCSTCWSTACSRRWSRPKPPGPRRIKISTGVEARRNNREPRVWLRVPTTAQACRRRCTKPSSSPSSPPSPRGIGTGLGLRSRVRWCAARQPARARDQRRRRGVPHEPADQRPAGRAHRAGGAGRQQQQRPGARAGGRRRGRDRRTDARDAGRRRLRGRPPPNRARWRSELLAAARFDAIVSDLRMPDMDGAALWREVRERWPALARRTLFVTGDTLSPGAEAFPKPAAPPGQALRPLRPVDRVATLLMGDASRRRRSSPERAGRCAEWVISSSSRACAALVLWLFAVAGAGQRDRARRRHAQRRGLARARCRAIRPA